jgi:hypothetical protein
MTENALQGSRSTIFQSPIGPAVACKIRSDSSVPSTSGFNKMVNLSKTDH